MADAEIATLLTWARAELAGSGLPATKRPFTVGLLFLSPSLRTRVGFSVAASRLGGAPVDVAGSRWAPGMSDAESFADTLRAVSGMVDIVVVRVPFVLDRDVVASCSVAPLVNAGDGVEHPTQAIVDLLAVEEERGPLDSLSIGVCGDLNSRSARSLLKVLERTPPRRLTLMSPGERHVPEPMSGGALAERTVVLDRADFADLDVLYLPGLPEGTDDNRLDATRRAEFALTAERQAELPADAVVLSPLPLIDEVSEEARGDPRLRFFAQSDRGVAVRMAVLRTLLSPSRPPEISIRLGV